MEIRCEAWTANPGSRHVIKMYAILQAQTPISLGDVTIDAPSVQVAEILLVNALKMVRAQKSPIVIPHPVLEEAS